MSIAVLLFISFGVLLLLNVPIGLALGSAAMICMMAAGVPMTTLPMSMYASIGKFTLLAIPFFILAGNIRSTQKRTFETFSLKKNKNCFTRCSLQTCWRSNNISMQASLK